MAALGQQPDGGGRPTKRDRRRFEESARERGFQ